MPTRVLNFERRYGADGKPRDYVEICSSSSILETGTVAVSTWHPVEHMRPKANEVTGDALKHVHRRAMWSVVEPAYAAWSRGHDVPDSGTPLAAWAGITTAQADVLRRMDIRSVEEMAAVGDGVLSRIPLPNARDLKRLASEWLSGKDRADFARQLQELRDQNAALLEAMQAQDEPAKRGPGRPRKDAEAA